MRIHFYLLKILTCGSLQLRADLDVFTFNFNLKKVQ